MLSVDCGEPVGEPVEGSIDAATCEGASDKDIAGSSDGSLLFMVVDVTVVVGFAESEAVVDDTKGATISSCCCCMSFSSITDKSSLGSCECIEDGSLVL